MLLFTIAFTFLASTRQEFDWMYFGIYIVCACGVYYAMAQRADKEIPRKTIDQIFFFILGMSSLIWFLSKFAAPMA
ncbi:MAG: hypothetical protein AAFV07_19100 [Bacteroidota bacterium]